MLREVLKSKIYYARVTQTELDYEGSITIDEEIINQADLALGEKVQVLNLNNGERFETYVIKGLKNSGVCCLNGPAVHRGRVGDKVAILSYSLLDEKELGLHKAKYVLLDDENEVKTLTLR